MYASLIIPRMFLKYGGGESPGTNEADYRLISETVDFIILQSTHLRTYQSLHFTHDRWRRPLDPYRKMLRKIPVGNLK